MSIGSEVAREAWDLAGPSSVGGAALASCKQHMEHIKKKSAKELIAVLISVLANNMEAKWRMNVGKG